MQCRIRKDSDMPTLIVERNIPGANALTHKELKEISTKSNSVVANLGESYVWHRTYAAGEKLYCIHEADSAEAIYRHAKNGGFPADLVAEITSIFGPETADAPA